MPRESLLIDSLISAFLENLESGLDAVEFRLSPERKRKGAPRRAAAQSDSGHAFAPRVQSAPFRIRPETANDRVANALAPLPARQRNSTADLLKGLNIKSNARPMTGQSLAQEARKCRVCDKPGLSLVKSQQPIARISASQAGALAVIGPEEGEEALAYLDKVMSSIGLSRAKGSLLVTRFPKCALRKALDAQDGADVSDADAQMDAARECIRYLDDEISLVCPLMIIFFGKEIARVLEEKGIKSIYRSRPFHCVPKTLLELKSDDYAKKELWNWLRSLRQYLIDAAV